MYQQILKKTATIIAVSALAIACKPDNDVNVKPPAYHIHKSDKLAIPASVELPANLPAGNTRIATYYATGVQKYKAQYKAGEPSVLEWVFVAPQADLYNKSNQKVGTHGAGPVWQLFNGQGEIYAQAFNPARTAASGNPYTIDWLLLKTKEGTTPTGIFANISYIQRIATQGGKAPSYQPSGINDTIDVPYTAVYRFSAMN